MEKKTKKPEEKVEKVAAAALDASIRGRKFEGYVIKKFSNRVTIQFEKIKFIKKYERYTKAKSKMHARLPENLKNEIKIGDYIQIAECRPLSKIIHFIVIKKIRDADVKKEIAKKIMSEEAKI